MQALKRQAQTSSTNQKGKNYETKAGRDEVLPFQLSVEDLFERLKSRLLNYRRLFAIIGVPSLPPEPCQEASLYLNSAMVHETSRSDPVMR